MFQTFFPLTNLAIVSKIICTGIVGNPTVVSHFFSSHKSSHSFKNYLHCDYWKSNRCFHLFSCHQSSHSFNNFLHWDCWKVQPLSETFFPLTNLPIVSTIFCTGIVGNLTDVSNVFSSQKSSHSLKNFLHWYC